MIATLQAKGANSKRIRSAIAASLARACEQDPEIMFDLMGKVLKKHMSGNDLGQASEMRDALDEVQLMITVELANEASLIGAESELAR